MLSKKQARFFFVAATLGFSGVFLWLTVDTISQVPERSNEDKLTAEVVAGKTIWDENNCMGCHTILGEGAYYAPELTKVVERRGEAWIRVFLKDPQAMYPGERKMVQYDFTEEEIDNLIHFFTWIGNIDTNGFPAKPDLVIGGAATGGPDPLAGSPEVYGQLCKACHAVGGVGGNVGPALDGVATRYDQEYLTKWLKDPTSVKEGTAMPKLPLTDPQISEITTWLGTLK